MTLPRRMRSAFLCGLSLTSVAVGATLMWAVDPGTTVRTKPGPPLFRSSAASSTEVDRLRNDAAVADAFATQLLVSLLLDRYDANGRDDDLYEAIIWIDRNLYLEENLTLAGRITARYCNHRIVRWHSLCNPGERLRTAAD